MEAVRGSTASMCLARRPSVARDKEQLLVLGNRRGLSIYRLLLPLRLLFVSNFAEEGGFLGKGKGLRGTVVTN